MRKFCAGILVMMLVGCAVTPGNRPSDHNAAIKYPEEDDAAPVKKDCTRLEAAARAYGDIFSPVKMQKRAIEDCSRGDPGACVATPVAIPFSIFLGVIGAPLIFPVLMMSPYTQRLACPQESNAMSAGVDDSNAQSGGTKLPQQDPAPSVDRP